MAKDDVQLNFRASPELLYAIDRLRGDTTRPAWVKQVVLDRILERSVIPADINQSES